MPVYRTTENDGHPTATLTMDDYDHPHAWPGPTGAPDTWPHSTIASLIHLFTGSHPEPHTDAGSDIPEALACHIAVLIEDWCLNDLDGPGEHPRGNFPHDQDTPATPAAVAYAALTNERTAFAARHVQEWYSQGIALYQAHSLPRSHHAPEAQ